MLIAYGPVPSRRLGKSLGVNHVPPKNCSYSCVYCQLGATTDMRCTRDCFFKPEKIVESVEKQVDKAEGRGEKIDYITFVPDGEPTLDVNLGKTARLLKSLGIKLAVISNASLIWLEEVRKDLMEFDWVSVKMDAYKESTWQKVNRPHGSLKLGEIRKGLLEFADEYTGYLATETMLIEGINDGLQEIQGIAAKLESLSPTKSYIAIPTRPPAEDWVQCADEAALNRAYQVFDKRIDEVEYLIGYEGDEFAFTGNIEDDILSITSVHPMRERGVKRLLSKADAGWDIVDELVEDEKLVELKYKNSKFYMRKISSR